MTGTSGLAAWLALYAVCLALVGPSTWRRWRSRRTPPGRRAADAVVVALLVGAGAALLAPWHGEHDVPGAGRVLGALAVVGLLAAWRRRAG